MKKYLLIAIIALLTFPATTAQNETRFEIIPHDEDDNTSGALAEGQILVINNLATAMDVKFSIDKTSWRRKTIQSKKGFDIYLHISEPYFYIQVCNDGSPVYCTDYRMRPKNKYVIKRESQTVVLKRAAQ